MNCPKCNSELYDEDMRVKKLYVGDKMIVVTIYCHRCFKEFDIRGIII